MPVMSDPRKLFMHELGDVLYAENLLTKALPKMAGEASDEELRAGFEEHLEETRHQVENLKKVFETLGASPKAETCPGMDGITQEHDQFMAQHEPSPAVLDLFLTGAAARTEHYEIAAYDGLISMAKALGERDCVPLLEENLRQEKAALSKLQSAAKRIGKQAAASVAA